MQIGDLVKDNFYGRIGIVIQIAPPIANQQRYLIHYLDDGGRNFRSKRKWLEREFFKKIS